MACCTRLLDNSGDKTLYQQGGTDHEQSIHDILGDIEALSEISFRQGGGTVSWGPIREELHNVAAIYGNFIFTDHAEG